MLLPLVGATQLPLGHGVRAIRHPAEAGAQHALPERAGTWECEGCPRATAIDNGPKFANRHPDDAARQVDFDLLHSPVRVPSFTGIVEGFFSRLNRQLLRSPQMEMAIATKVVASRSQLSGVAAMNNSPASCVASCSACSSQTRSSASCFLRRACTSGPVGLIRRNGSTPPRVCLAVLHLPPAARCRTRRASCAAY